MQSHLKFQTFFETSRDWHSWCEHWKNAMKEWGHRACLQVLTNSCYQIVSPEFYFLYIQDLIKQDLEKHFSKKINETRKTWRFDDFMSSLSNELIRNNGKAWKFKVALHPMYRIFSNFAKSCISSCLLKFFNKKKFHRAVFEIWALKVEIKGVFSGS